MKTKLKISLIVLALIWSGFRLTKDPKQEEAFQLVRNEIIEYYFETQSSYDREGTYPDTSIRLPSKNKNGAPRYLASYCAAQYAPVGVYGSWYDNHRVAVKALDNQQAKPPVTYGGIDTVFYRLYGVFPRKEGFNMAAKWYNGTAKTFIYYNPIALQTAFNNLYKKPMEKWNGFTYQRIYDVAFRSYAREVSTLMARILSHRQLFNSLAAEYAQKAKTDPNFDGQTFGSIATEKLMKAPVTDDEIIVQKCNSHVYADMLIGTLLRRQIDGSLPTCLNIIKTIIKDYDPEHYAEIAPKLK